MNKDRFKDYREEVKRLVLDFEAMQRRGDDRYYDVDQLETIIDFYLETADGDGLEKSVRYGERLFPTSNEIRLRRAHLLCFKEHYREAYTLLKKLQQMEPDNTDVLYALGVVHSALDHPRKAIQYYHQAAADGYDLGTIYGNIADEYVRMEQPAEARRYYRRALRQNPDDERSLYELANCYEDEGLSDKWIHYFTNFVAEHPYSKVAWYCLGEGYVYERLYEKAIDAYQYALAIDNDFLYAYLQLSLCHYETGDYVQAVNALHDALPHTEDKAYLYYRIGDIFRHINNLVTSNVYLHKAVKEDPYYAEAWHVISLNYSMTRNYTAAIEAAKRAAKIDPESPLFLTTLALIYADSGDDDNADRIFDCAKPYYCDFEQGWLGMADYLIIRQRYDDAAEALAQGLPECEMVTEFNKRLALCYLRTGKRNMLYNAVRACVYNSENGEQELLDYIPELGEDLDVMNIIVSHRNEKEHGNPYKS